MDGTIVEVSIFLFCLKCFTFHYNYLQWGDCYNFPLLRTVFLSSPLFMIILFSLLIRFQVLILLDASQVCTSFMMILRHLMTVIKRTIFDGGIVWNETLQLTGCAPVLATLKIEFDSFFFLFIWMLMCFLWHDISTSYTTQLFMLLIKFLLFQVDVWSICKNCVWLHGRNGRYHKS